MNVGWLCETNEMNPEKGEAFCKICRSQLRAQKNDLKKHANTATHRQNASTLDVNKQPKISTSDLMFIFLEHSKDRKDLSFFHSTHSHTGFGLR